MLPADRRLRTSADFAAVLRRRGRVSASAHLLIVHANRLPGRENLPSRVGFVVGKNVGNAVLRNRTKRRLREQCRARLALLVDGTDYVVRAQPAASGAPSSALGSALDAALADLSARGGERR
ncbi:MAG: ribonuclease P protein component [Actinobacteria bacterium]|nr:ribonuclease P protein component [Actinomycetota bacterium]